MRGGVKGDFYQKAEGKEGNLTEETCQKLFTTFSHVEEKDSMMEGG